LPITKDLSVVLHWCNLNLFITDERTAHDDFGD